jgi:stress response protein YsnF
VNGRGDPYEADHRDLEVRSVHHGADVSRGESGWRISVPLRQEHVVVRRDVVATREFRVSTRLAEASAEFHEKPRADPVSDDGERRSR